MEMGKRGSVRWKLAASVALGPLVPGVIDDGAFSVCLCTVVVRKELSNYAYIYISIYINIYRIIYYA